MLCFLVNVMHLRMLCCAMPAVQGIARHGDLNRLLQRKSFLRQEVGSSQGWHAGNRTQCDAAGHYH